MLFCFWYVALSYMAFPRIIFAWGMDRMGPERFTSIDLRWARVPVKSYILCFVLCQAAIALLFVPAGQLHAGPYGHRYGDRLGVGHHHHRGAHLPLREARQGHLGSRRPTRPGVLGIPLVSWGAAVSLVYLGILTYFLLFTEEMKDSNGQSWILYGIVWIIGVLWYFFWKSRSKKVGVDVSMTYGELPPE